MRKLPSLLLAALAPAYCQGQVAYETPPSISSSNGTLDTSLTLEVETVSIPGTNLLVTTRLFNGQFPGPTLRLKAGDLLRVHYTNALPESNGNAVLMAYRHNTVSAPDETNLHFHGLHISGILPSDDVSLVLTPGESYQYETQLPSNHMPGTHWMHPHRHGSSALQTGGGAVAAVIVEDEDNDVVVPAAVAEATEILFLVHLMDLERLQELADDSNDEHFQVSIDDTVPAQEGVQMRTDARLHLVNGRYQPVITGVTAGSWMRFRLIWSSWVEGKMDLRIPNCEMHLLAKDGIYISDFPRSINMAPIVPGGRADVMVSCPEPSTTYEILGPANVVLATVVTSNDPAATPTQLSPWSPNYPDYLSDLTSTPATEGCTCNTVMDRRHINGRLYQQDEYLHETFVGAVVERNLRVNDHPYHQHVYPFMLVGGFGDNNNYNQIGDWQDSVEGRGTIRYRVTSYEGSVMVHCHRLEHEDEGMMSKELVHPETNGACLCVSGAFNRSGGFYGSALSWMGMAVVSAATLLWI